MSSVSVVPVGPVATISGANTSIRGVQGVPDGFPQLLKSPLTWIGRDFKEEDYIYHLTESDKTEIERARQHFMNQELDGFEAGPDNFPLPTLGHKLREMSQVVYNGKGFCLIRGFDIKQYPVEDATAIFFGVQSYIADQRGRQDGHGNILVHINADKSSELSKYHHRHSNEAITFHNEEAADVVCWMTRSTAESGGKCVISSAYQTYNELATSHPEYIRTLAKSNWAFSLPHFKCRPVIFYENGRLITNFGRTPLLGSVAHPRPAHLPSINESQRAALDAIETVADKNRLEITTQPGDMHFINNLAVFHRRDGFVDGAEKRHLIRTWNRDSENGWKIPSDLAREYRDAFERDDFPSVCHIEPMPEGFFPLRKYPN